MPTRYIQSSIRRARASYADATQFTEELFRYGDELRKQVWGPSDKEMEHSLWARGDPLIDLALAENASNKEVVAALYAKSLGTPKDVLEERYFAGLRNACLANEVRRGALSKFPVDVIGKKEFERVVREGDGEVAALFTNPQIDDDILVALYANEGIFASLTEDRRRGMVQISSENPRLVTNEDSEHGPDLGFGSIHRAILRMLATAPTNADWLFTLRNLLDALDPRQVEYPEGDITPVLERWSTVDLGDNDLDREGYLTGLSMKDEFRCLIAALYGRHMTRKGKSTKFDTHILGGPDSPELVQRCAYYGRGSITKQEMIAGYARDGDSYLFALLHNDNVFHARELRTLLETEQLRGNFRYTYRRRCSQIHRHSPAFDERPVSEWLQEELPPESKELEALTAQQVRLDGIAKSLESLKTWTFWGFIALGMATVFLRHRLAGQTPYRRHLTR